MKRLVAVILLLFYHFNTFAENSLPIGTNEKLAQQCFIDICGNDPNPLQIVSHEKSLWGEGEPWGKWLKESINPLLDRLLEQNVELSRIHQRSLVKLINKIDWKTLPDAERALIFNQFIDSLQREKVDSSELYTADENGFLIHTDAQLEKRYHHLPKKLREHVIKSIIAIDRNTIYQFTESLSPEMSLELVIEKSKNFFRDWISDVDYGPWNSLEAINLNLSVRRVRQWLKLGPLTAVPHFKKVLSQIRLDNSVTPENLPIFIEAYRAILNFDVIAFGTVTPILAKANLAPSQIKDALNLHKRLNDIREVSSKSFEKYKKDLKNRLRSAIQTLISAAPTNQEIRYAEDLTVTIKGIAAQVVEEMQGLTPAEVEKAKEAVVNQKMILPKERRQIANFILNDLQALIEQNDEELQNTKEILNSNSDFWPMLLVKALDSLPKDRKHLLSKLEAYLNSLSPKTFNNYAFSELPMTELGWETVKFPTIGIGITAHELGHTVSGVIGPRLLDNFSSILRIPTNEVMAVRICTAKKHFDSETWNPKKPMYYAEEDWADIFSNAIKKRLQNTKIESQNPFCAMISTVDIDSPELTRSLRNSFSWDRHSSLIYRLIQAQLSGKTLPKSCTDFVNLPAEAPFFQSCDVSKNDKLEAPENQNSIRSYFPIESYRY